MDLGHGSADSGEGSNSLTDEFFSRLSTLYVQVGEPPLRAVAARRGKLSASNISSLLSGRRKALPQYEVLCELIEALMHDRPDAEIRAALVEWRELWAQARMAQRSALREANSAIAERGPRAVDTAEGIIAAAKAEAKRIMAKARTDGQAIIARAEQAVTEQEQQADAHAYTQAVAQLGDAGPMVRIGGVYALAGIADSSARYRSVCLKVLCAYLRMPYDPNEAEPAERQVRAAVQTVIAERLRPGHPGFWNDAETDLSGALLVDLDFSDVRTNFIARKATFSGQTRFNRAMFSGHADFEEASFHGVAHFSGAVFDSRAGFDGTTFDEDAWFNHVIFNGNSALLGARFSKNAGFDHAAFNGGDALNEPRSSKDTPSV